MPSAKQPEIGAVLTLWRYPVKSMMGEELNSSEVTERGLLGDRAFALVDNADGKIATAKNPRKWPNLFDFSAAFVGSPRVDAAVPVRVTLPNGSTASSQQGDVHQILSGALNRQVRLQAAAPGRAGQAVSEEYWPDMEGLDYRDTVTDFELPEGTFFDCATVHVLTTATLDRLRQLYPAGRFEVRRFRPNVVIEAVGDERAFVEESWVGHTILVGDQVRLKITEPCPRCVMTTLAQGDLPADRGILRTAAQHNDVHVGVYASVQQGGTIRRGDHVRLE